MKTSSWNILWQQNSLNFNETGKEKLKMQIAKIRNEIGGNIELIELKKL